MERNAILIDPRDNVVVVTRDIAAGETVAWAGGSIVARTAIPVNHKISIAPLAEGTTVLKYGHAIGTASVAIEAGAHVHSHCMRGKE
jgi:altronate hydrolase